MHSTTTHKSKKVISLSLSSKDQSKGDIQPRSIKLHARPNKPLNTLVNSKNNNRK